MRQHGRIDGYHPHVSVSAMTVKNTDGSDRPAAAEQPTEPQRGADLIAARKKLIDGIIANNQMQLRNECARGGAEIERECALRDAAREGAGPDALAELERVTARLQALQEEQQRLIAERSWLDTSWMELEISRSANARQTSGQA
jgi:hypothetical protein